MIKKVSLIGSIFLSGTIIWQVAVYFFSRWQQIMQLDDLSFQSIFLFTVLIVYMAYSLFILVAKNIKGALLFMSSVFFILSAGIKAIFYIKAFAEKQPFELVYVANEISTFMFFLCLLFIASTSPTRKADT